MLPDAPYWQPISMLSMVAAIIDGVAYDANQRRMLLARVVGHVGSMTEVRELWRWAQYVAPDAQFYMQRLTRWQTLELTPDQRSHAACWSGSAVSRRRADNHRGHATVVPWSPCAFRRFRTHQLWLCPSQMRLRAPHWQPLVRLRQHLDGIAVQLAARHRMLETMIAQQTADTVAWTLSSIQALPMLSDVLYYTDQLLALLALSHTSTDVLEIARLIIYLVGI